MTKDDENYLNTTHKCPICDKRYTNKDIRVRDHGHNTGKYRGSYHHQNCNLKFIDSFQYMSLDSLVSNLPKLELLKYTYEKFWDIKLDLMSETGIYHYDFMDSFDKFDKTELPTKK